MPTELEEVHSPKSYPPHYLTNQYQLVDFVSHGNTQVRQLGRRPSWHFVSQMLTVPQLSSTSFRTQSPVP